MLIGVCRLQPDLRLGPGESGDTNVHSAGPQLLSM